MYVYVGVRVLFSLTPPFPPLLLPSPPLPPAGPLGITFSNTINDKTTVEKVGKAMQSDLSDVQPGDVVIAVDQYNVTGSAARITQRVMGSLGWPRK